MNQVEFIEETIRSVLRQEGDFDLEYIVVDGGSVDGSINVIRKYSDMVCNGGWRANCNSIEMYWASDIDRGQTNAINIGIEKASGNILAYLNSDDTYLPGALQKVSNAFIANPISDFVFGDGEVINEYGEVIWEWLSRPYNLRVLSTYHFLWNDFTNYIMQQATFWRRSVHDDLGPFDESFEYAMDVEFWIRAGSRGYCFTHIREPLARFRLIRGTKSTSSPTVFWQDYLEIFRRYSAKQDLSRYFGFFLFNLARENEYCYEVMIEKGNMALARWEMLPISEVSRIYDSYQKGLTRACFLIANQLRREKLMLEAEFFFRQGTKRHRSIILYPSAAWYIAAKFLGWRLSYGIERLLKLFVQIYRRVVFDYRYALKRYTKRVE